MQKPQMIWNLPIHIVWCVVMIFIANYKETTVKPLITDPPRSGQPLYSGRLTCPRLILP